MSNTRQLKTLLRLRRLEELKQQKQVADAQNSYRTQQAMSQQLAQYREDYQFVNHHPDHQLIDVAQPNQAADDSSAVKRLQNASQFMLKLNRAEHIQAQTEAESFEKLSAARTVLQTEMASCKALDTLIDSRLKQSASAALKRESAESQDIWTATHLRRR